MASIPDDCVMAHAQKPVFVFQLNDESVYFGRGVTEGGVTGEAVLRHSCGRYCLTHSTVTVFLQFPSIAFLLSVTQ